MSLKSTLLSAGSALILSAGAASAAPAVADSAVNLRAGPGTQYQVIDTIPGGATVDVAGCTGSWCHVTFNGEIGYASRNYLQMAGGGGSAGVVAVAPGYVYEDAPIYDDDYGYAYGPSVGLYVNPGYGYRQGWRGNRLGTWQGRQGWSGSRTGAWQGRPGWQGGGNRMGNIGGSRGAGMPSGMNRPGNISPQMSAPAGMRSGASVGGAPAGGAAASIGRGQAR
jgi:uncharacterized protein YraI